MSTRLEEERLSSTQWQYQHTDSIAARSVAPVLVPSLLHQHFSSVGHKPFVGGELNNPFTDIYTMIHNGSKISYEAATKIISWLGLQHEELF